MFSEVPFQQTTRSNATKKGQEQNTDVESESSHREDCTAVAGLIVHVCAQEPLRVAFYERLLARTAKEQEIAVGIFDFEATQIVEAQRVIASVQRLTGPQGLLQLTLENR